MILKNGTLIQLWPSSAENLDLRIQDGTVVATGKNLRPKSGEEVVDLSGQFLFPGMVNAHTHLYSALARGMSGPMKSPKNFTNILKKIWWKLDEALDEESTYFSALVGSIEALKYGTTTLIDHHASPNCISGSLDTIKEGMNAVGLRGVLCYETTDRGGRAKRDAGLEENARFVAENASGSHFRGLIGAHASFTLSDLSMHALGELAKSSGTGVHIHVAEDKADVDDSVVKRGIRLVQRLEKFNLLSPKSIFAHAVHLSKAELARVDSSGTWIVHNPRSNMNNAVGYAPLQWFGTNTALGTDGFPADMFEETKIGFFRNQESESRVAFHRLPEMLQAGQRLASQLFEREFGSLEVGSPADLIVMNYSPPTPLNQSNPLGHFIFGMNSGMVAHSMVNGQWAMFNRQLVGIDEEKVMAEAAKVAKKLWQRMG